MGSKLDVKAEIFENMMLRRMFGPKMNEII
jgi:hypothetical protein